MSNGEDVGTYPTRPVQKRDSLRRYVRAEWSCLKCGASNPARVKLNREDAQDWDAHVSKRFPPPPPRLMFEPTIRYRELASMEVEAGWLEVECPRCGHLQRFACEDAREPTA